MNHKEEITKEDLTRLYFVERKSLREIGKIYNCSAATISNRLKEHGLCARSYHEALVGRENTWAHKTADKLRGKKRPGVGGRKKGCVGWSKGLTKQTDARLQKTGKQKQNHWAWKGGVSSINALIRQTPTYKQWRKDVFERDNFTCRKCFQRGGNLEAHHIEEFALNHDLRFNVDNGLTLCVKCHKELHRKEKQNGNK